jgi:uncharacterized membrane protein YphA (DoxX/SURF4 family)
MTRPSAPAASSRLPGRLDQIDRAVTEFLARLGIPILRIAIGIVFLWFGLLKFFPNLSPAEELAGRTIEVLTLGVVKPAVSLPVLAAWETVIGLGLISGRFLRGVLFLLAVQMVGTLLPLVFFPAETFSVFPIAPTLEGQYILKNVVIIGGAMVVGATVRGGRIDPEPTDPEPTGDGRPAELDQAGVAPSAGAPTGPSAGNG